MENASRLVFTFLLNSLWQLPLICGAAWLAARFLRNGPASHRHALWITALVVSLILPTLSLRSHTAPGPRPFFAVEVPHASPASAAPAAPLPSTPSPRTPDFEYAPSAAALLAALYGCFVLYRATRLAWSWRNAAALRRRASVEPMPQAVNQAFTRARTALQTPGAALRWSRDVRSPVMTGVIHRSVLLPESMQHETSEDILATAIGHELGHAARHDFLSNLLCEILALPIAAHPASLFLMRRIRETRELACDEFVTRRLIAPREYARSMTAIAAQLIAPPPAACTLGVFDGDILEERIRRLVDAPPRLRHARVWLAAGLAALAATAIIASSLAISAHAQSTQPQIAANATVEQLRQALAQAPNNATLHQRLAQALAEQGRPGTPDPLYDEARAEYLKALALQPGNQATLEGLMLLGIHAKTYDDARLWAKQLLAADPNRVSALYSTGFLDWVTAYPDYAQARAGMPDMEQGQIANDAARQAFCSRYRSQIDEGIAMELAAVRIAPDYSDAMAYENLLLRLKAGCADTPTAATALVSEANDWVSQALAAKHRVASGAAAPVARPAGELAPPPPPPPPPPPANVERETVSTTPAPPHHGEGQGAFWQVAASRPITVSALLDSLKASGFHGMRAIVDKVDSSIKIFVMVGPYEESELSTSKAALEAAGYRVIGRW